MSQRNSNIPGLVTLHRMFGNLARHKGWAIVAAGLITLAIRAAMIPAIGIPQPEHHDEFSYLLSADTFAHGRMANPTHPMWVHFETFHVIQQPTYSSIYPPAQGLVLAIGEFLGHPWIGEWLITGLMCSAICWMLQGWLPPTWALYGAMLAVLRLGILRYWMNGYWSSSVVALGGALLIGALPRIKKNKKVGDAILMGIGVVILADCRPFEGFVLSVTVAIALLIWMAGPRGPAFKVTAARVIVPLAIVIAAGAVATGFFYYRVTGSPIKMTYQIDSLIYNPVPYFLWQTPRPEPVYRHEVMRAFYEQDLAQFLAHRAPDGFLRYVATRLSDYWSFYLGAVLTIPIVMLPWSMRDHCLRYPVIAGGILLIALMSESWGMPHYAAPAAGLLLLIIVQCTRHLSLLTWKNLKFGRYLAQAIPLLLFGTLVLRIVSAVTHPDIQKNWPRGNLARASVLNHLKDTPGKHLVIVDYGPGHDVKQEWIYNLADIDASPVIWARDMGQHDNKELSRYFSDRKIWRLQADETPPKLSPYSDSH
jgi:hypothetical protein